MKDLGIKLKTGSLQEYSSKLKNIEQTGVALLSSNGKQMQLGVKFLRPECLCITSWSC